MALSNAEKQRAYRQRHLVNGMGERLSIIINVDAKRKLERLARHSGMSQRAMLEWQLSAAERRQVSCIEDQDVLAAYYDRVTG